MYTILYLVVSTEKIRRGVPFVKNQDKFSDKRYSPARKKEPVPFLYRPFLCVRLFPFKNQMGKAQHLIPCPKINSLDIQIIKKWDVSYFTLNPDEPLGVWNNERLTSKKAELRNSCWET